MDIVRTVYFTFFHMYRTLFFSIPIVSIPKKSNIINWTLCGTLFFSGSCLCLAGLVMMSPNQMMYPGYPQHILAFYRHLGWDGVLDTSFAGTQPCCCLTSFTGSRWFLACEIFRVGSEFLYSFSSGMTMRGVQRDSKGHWLLRRKSSILWPKGKG